MEIFGNLERLAAGLYPYRWPISVVVILVLAGSAYLIYERGWHTVLWRRPLMTAIVAVPLLAIALPVSYYLISPLWTRSHLEEASPLMVADAQITEQRVSANSTPAAESAMAPEMTPASEATSTPESSAVVPIAPTPARMPEPTQTAQPAIVNTPEAPPTSEPATEPTAEIIESPRPEPVIEPEPTVESEPESEPFVEPEPTAEPQPEPAPVEFVPAVVRSGSFYGADDFHFGSGSALIIETEPGVYVLRFENFSVQNGPDLFVYLSTSPDGYGDGSYSLGQLKATDGSFNYDIPPGIDPWSYGSVIIWCEPFAVLFATAPLG
ncbi:MAG: DM13 domain-containing protein [Chloroflexia bacterium]|nr:DM13 domain-containing protein [Chloroflexia bacterium]